MKAFPKNILLACCKEADDWTNKVRARGWASQLSWMSSKRMDGACKLPALILAAQGWQLPPIRALITKPDAIG